ncbi:hypothetical protein TIFTF001_029256 [Ficus carica]|uniref:MD-2-related lipid-recognition domain-containing protein n=1 Tax=Ficus carica TaxID=3494 RepID=A0AA88DVK0_FICCA|nr:hypothetical protein TIFTF001_029256 [Ficus carica]
MEKLSFVALFFFSSLFLLLPSSHSTNVKYCDKKGNYAVKVNAVKISLDPVVSGKPATFNISASTGRRISGGKLVIDVSYFGLHVHTETHELNEEIPCPIDAGNFVLSHTRTLPGFTPPVSSTIQD